MSYVKDAPSVAERISERANGFGQGLLAAATVVGEGVTAAAGKTKFFASSVAESAVAAWEERAPSKEALVGTVVLGGVAPLVIGKEGVEQAGAKVISAASDAVDLAATKLKNVSPWAVIGGAIVGVGAIAAAPFTGGGSVLGAATLAGSLSGAAGAAAAAGNPRWPGSAATGYWETQIALAIRASRQASMTEFSEA